MVGIEIAAGTLAVDIKLSWGHAARLEIHRSPFELRSHGEVDSVGTGRLVVLLEVCWRR